MKPAPQQQAIGALLALTLLSVPACHEPMEETVTPVQLAPSDEVESPSRPGIEQLRVRVVAKYPHAPDAFTQGLIWHDGAMYESTGRYGKSSLRRVRLEDGEILAERSLDPSFFAEGLAVVDDRLIQLTWRAGLALVSDLQSLEQRDTLRYPGEGWGLCFDGSALVMSDGSSILNFRDPDSMELVKEMTVWRGSRPVQKLNELECVGDDVYANIWQSDEIVRIDRASGQVTAVIDASGLLSRVEATRADVLNGIAHKPDSETFLLTGKLWPHVFEVELVQR
ncbi:MAG: glutaminyl-peptide cyclotransferase [Myxococcales bacterium]|nr:MAG: glutaminyl-peptide cyclotransferase [Myxococcales bacterium]